MSEKEQKPLGVERGVVRKGRVAGWDAGHAEQHDARVRHALEAAAEERQARERRGEGPPEDPEEQARLGYWHQASAKTKDKPQNDESK